MLFKKIVFFIAILLSGCVETVVVGTVATGAYVMSDGSIFDTDQDSRIESSIKRSLKKSFYKDKLKHIQVNVFNSRILLTGYVENDPNYKHIASNIAKSTKDEIEVIDEIIIINSNYNIGSFADSIISSQISMKLKTASEIKSGNYRYDVVDGSVYIIGSARSQEELKKTTKIISEIKGVKKVVSYIKI